MTEDDLKKHLHENYRHKGNKVIPCPECSHLRQKKKARCMRITQIPEGLLFYCHHCGVDGAAWDEDKEPPAYKPSMQSRFSARAAAMGRK